MADQGSRISAFFLPSAGGRILAVHHVPRQAMQPRQAYIILPPFAEEMNRSRRVAHLQAQALAEAGFDAVLLDLYGTGDSEGDFKDADWNYWLDDVAHARIWLSRQGMEIVGLIGLRLGAMLAAAAARNDANAFSHLLLWQPVVEGKTLLTQHLRVRLAASLTEGGQKETTEQLRGLFQAGQSVEVAGYDLSPVFAAQLDSLRLAELAPREGLNIDWIEIAKAEGDPLLPASQKLIDGWRSAGSTVSTHTVSGQPFWTIQETTLAPALVAKTLEIARGHACGI